MFTLEEIFEEICVAIYEAIFNNVWDWWEPIIFRITIVIKIETPNFSKWV